MPRGGARPVPVGTANIRGDFDANRVNAPTPVSHRLFEPD